MPNFNHTTTPEHFAFVEHWGRELRESLRIPPPALRRRPDGRFVSRHAIESETIVYIAPNARRFRGDDYSTINRMSGTYGTVSYLYDRRDDNTGDRAYHVVDINNIYADVVHEDFLRVVGAAEQQTITRFCANHRRCSAQINEDNPQVRTPSGHTGCTSCVSECDQCGEANLPHYLHSYQDSGRAICSNCVDYCDECEQRYDPHQGCHGFHRGVRSYGHTSATMWLGGPVPRNADNTRNGYYLGIELEISADDDESAMPIYEWAEANLGSRDAIVCKEDGSVEGFEIVTQPMTPQFFESVNWESFMDLINDNHPISSYYGEDEPSEHGLHVHIGRTAFNNDDVAIAAYSYLMAQGDHMERIGRREAYHYCEKVTYPVSQAISAMGERKQTAQVTKVQCRGIWAARNAINLQNSNTIEIRAFRSTRSANELRNAVRLTYIAAEYIRYLRVNREAVSPKSLHWGAFCAWVSDHYPEALASISGSEESGFSNKMSSTHANVRELVNIDE